MSGDHRVVGLGLQSLAPALALWVSASMCVARPQICGASEASEHWSLLAGAPLVSMAPRIHGHRNQPLLVSCSVHSALPFRLQLYRSGVRLGEERHFL